MRARGFASAAHVCVVMITVTYKQSYEAFSNTIGDAIRSQLTRAATCTQTATGLYVFCKYYIALVDVLLVRP